MDNLYFIVRFTPFWAIPVMIIAAEFAYIFWLRKRRKVVIVCLALISVSLLFLSYYFIAGGPVKSVKLLIDLVHYYTR